MFKKLFNKNKTSADESGDGNNNGKPAIPTDFDDLADMADAHLDSLTNAHDAAWGVGKADKWDVDLEKGVITWTFPDKIASAPAELIGTYSEAEQSFLWGWDHPSVPAGTAVAAAKVKAFADENAIELLQDRKLICELEGAWTLSAIASLVGDLQGVYRGPAGSGSYVFIGFGEVKLTGT